MAPLMLKLHTKAFVSAVHRTQRISVAVDGQQVAQYTARYPASQLTMQIPLGRLASDDAGPVKVVFSLPDAVSPQSLGISGDGRELALGLLDAQAVPVQPRSVTSQPPASAGSR